MKKKRENALASTAFENARISYSDSGSHLLHSTDFKTQSYVKIQTPLINPRRILTVRRLSRDTKCVVVTLTLFPNLNLPNFLTAYPNHNKSKKL